MKVLLIMIGVLLTQLVVAEEIKPAERTIIETWKCYAISDRSQKNALVHLTREHQLSVIHALAGSKLEVGTVSVAGTKYDSVFQVDGFDRRWDFGRDSKSDERWPYSFVIKPDGDGSYYNFTTEATGVKPSQVFKCVMK